MKVLKSDVCFEIYAVFDVTEYAPQHPGGASLVTSNCGLDDTESYSLFHTYSELDGIRQYFKGMLTEEPQGDSSTPATATDSVPGSLPESPAASDIPILENGMVHFLALQHHSIPDDCWFVYYGEVYDMTVSVICACGPEGVH